MTLEDVSVWMCLVSMNFKMFETFHKTSDMTSDMRLLTLRGGNLENIDLALVEIYPGLL